MEEQNIEHQTAEKTKKPSKKIKRKIAFILLVILAIFAVFYLVKEMQYVSTDICKKYFGVNCWCEMLKKNIEDIGCKNYIIDDIRFISDYTFWFNSDEDISIKMITHRNAPNQYNKKDATHPSETETDKIECQYTIINDGSYEDLYKQLDEIIKSKIK